MLPDRQAISWTIQAAVLSDVGLVRQQNEDRNLVDTQHQLFIVSDGIGGRNAGAVAAEIVVTVLPAILQQRLGGLKAPDLVPQRVEIILNEAIRELSRRLFSESQGRVGLQGMGATVALVWCYGNTAYLAHMGDSRIYLFRQKHLSQITQDHTVLELLRRNQEISPEEARHHPARGRLARYVGMDGDVHPHVQHLLLYPDDRLLICSDGLSGMMPASHIEHLLREYPEPTAACAALVQAAKDGGGTDNITTLVIKCIGHESKRESLRDQILRPTKKERGPDAGRAIPQPEQGPHTGQSKHEHKDKRMQAEDEQDEDQTEIEQRPL